MSEKAAESPVRIIGSRELHQNLPGILRELEGDKVRYVLTVHGKPRAVLIGAEPYLNLILDGKRPSEALVGLQLTALLGGNLDSHSLTTWSVPSCPRTTEPFFLFSAGWESGGEISRAELGEGERIFF